MPDAVAAERRRTAHEIAQIAVASYIYETAEYATRKIKYIGIVAQQKGVETLFAHNISDPADSQRKVVGRNQLQLFLKFGFHSPIL